MNYLSFERDTAFGIEETTTKKRNLTILEIKHLMKTIAELNRGGGLHIDDEI